MQAEREGAPEGGVRTDGVGRGVEAPSPDAVLRELERVAASPGFSGAPQLTRFLRYVVEETLAGRGSQLNQYRVAVEALGQDDRFDPVVDAMVRTYANRLRRALDSYYEGPGHADDVRIRVPRGTYTAVFTHRGVDVEETGTSRRRDQPRSPDRAAAELTPTVALLPFRNLSPNGDHPYVAAGLTEELGFALTRYSDFTVVGPLSRERLLQEGLGPIEIGHRYGARFLLDGSTSLSGDRIVVRARLTDTRNGAIAWTEAYDRAFDQDAVPGTIEDIGVSVLGATVDVHGSASRLLSADIAEMASHTVESQQAMLMFHSYLRNMTPDAHVMTKAALQHVRKHEPLDAPIAAALGGMYVTDYTHYGEGSEALDRGLALTETSVRLDPDDHFVQFEAAYVYFYTKDVAEFRRMAELSVLSNPRTSNHGDTALFFALAGDSQRARELFAVGRRANPHHPGQFHLAPYFASAYEGDFEEALESANRIQMPGYFLGPLVQAAALGHLGRLDEAELPKTELLSLVPRFEDRARDILERLLRYDQPVDVVLDGLQKAGLEV